jgi:phage baseplate assembly protein W
MARSRATDPLAGQFRAVRFLHPQIDVPEAEAGLTISATGGIAMVEGHASVRQAVLLLLTTVPGERVMRPDYGCELHRLMFLPNDATTAGIAIHYVRQAIERWEPRVEILALDANRSEIDPSKLIIMLEYRVRATQRVEGLNLPINLSGE